MQILEQFIDSIQKSISNNNFIKITFSNYKGSENELKNCYVKKVIIKNEDKFSFTYRYKTRDIVKNYSSSEMIDLVSSFLHKKEFYNATFFSLENDIVLEIKNDNRNFLKKNPPSHTELPSLEHNNQKKKFIIPEGKSYLQALKITNDKGIVIHNSSDKFKQINRYIELLNPLIQNLSSMNNIDVVDMGSGKGYLTFALYDYLINVLKLNANVHGIEFRDDLVKLCNLIASQSNFKNLWFKKGTILDVTIEKIDVLIALHACDTATDDAIFKGIKSNAKLIVVAPCCHKQIRREIEKSAVKTELDFMLKHGIFLERQSEMITDSLRALYLEYFDYSTKVFEFISDAHTPKNIMIVAEYKPKNASQKTDILNKINSAKDFFGIKQHHLGSLLNL